jgi:hypothetical protein
MSLILSGSDGVSDIDGTVSTPAIRGTDANTGIFFPAADTIAFSEGGAEAMRIDSSGNVGIGTSSPVANLDVSNATSGGLIGAFRSTGVNGGYISFQASGSTPTTTGYIGAATRTNNSGTITDFGMTARTNLVFGTNDGTERMRITSGGDLLVGKTSSALGTAGFETRANGETWITRSASNPLYINRLTNDGDLVIFYQDTVSEGFISVSGTTVSYNGGHLARVSQMPNNSKDETILKGTVLTNLDDMCVWVKDGEALPNEQLNKMKVSDVEGDTNVAGVFVNWTRDEDCNSDDMNIAMTGDMIIRIANGVVVQKGDLLMSAGDGTAKPQGDDIVRSKTIAKVTSNHVTCTYADGSYCVPCVLMAC